MPAHTRTIRVWLRLAVAVTLSWLLIAGSTASATSDDSHMDRVETTINQSVDFDVLLNDPAGARLVDFSQPAHGAVTVKDHGRLRYLPVANFVGQDSFSYRVQTESAGTLAIPVSIIVSGHVTAVEARNDRGTTDEDVPIAVPVTRNDAPGPGGASLTVTIDGQPAFGLATVQADGSVLYVPSANWAGEDSFSYVASDGRTVDAAKVAVIVNTVPDGPEAVDDAVRMRQDGTSAIDLLANDSDPEGDEFALTRFTQPGHGTATWSDVDRMIIYSPSLGFWGTDQFTYAIADHDGSDSATVTITVNGAPILADDNVETLQDTPVKVDVLANDSDPESRTLAISGVTTPAHGTVLVNPDLTITYQPARSFSGKDEFTYSVEDDRGNTRSAIVTVTVTPLAVKRSAMAEDDEFLVLEDSPGNTLDLISNDKIPIDGSLVVAVDTTPAHGTVTVDALQLVTYVPVGDFSGRDTFTYSIVDSAGARSTATVTIEVEAVNDLPNAGADSATAGEDTRIVIDVLANDADVDRDTLVVESVTTPGHGTARITRKGAIAYTPSQDYVGPDEFSYVASDGHGGRGTGVVTITVSAVNDPPHAVNDRQKIAPGEEIVIDVLANDSDADTAYLSVTITSVPGHGTAAITATNKIYYAPAPGFAGVDTFTYEISDGLSVDSASVRITVGTPKSKPNAHDDHATTQAESPVVIDTTANDDGPAGGALTVTSVSRPRHGNVTVADDELTYTPEPGFTGQDSFDYTVQDESGGTDSATVRVDVAKPKARNGKTK